MTATFKVVNGDIVVSSATGRPLLVEGSEKLSQDARENLDSEPQADGTGAGLDEVISLVGDVFSLRAEISRRINDSFDALRRVQDSVQRFDRTPEERFSRVARVVVTALRSPKSSTIDQTQFAYRVDILSVKGGKEATITGALKR